jgi:hypothetical protein
MRRLVGDIRSNICTDGRKLFRGCGLRKEENIEQIFKK